MQPTGQPGDGGVIRLAATVEQLDPLAADARGRL